MVSCLAEWVRRLHLVAGSAQLVVVALLSYVPSNLVRVAALRSVGASVGRGTVIHHGLGIRAAWRVCIGEDVWIDEGVRLDGRGRLVVGNHVSIGAGVQIWTAQHDWRSADFAYVSSPVNIGDRSWISSRAVVLPGVVIGEGAVVAAGAVVVRDVAPWTLVGGVPARVLGKRPVGMGYELGARQNKMWWW